jgi:K+-transporting ATPase KdpF subunit
MTDVLLLILLVGAFIGFAGYVTVCDRIVGPDDTHDLHDDTGRVALVLEPRRRGGIVNLESIAGLVIAAGLFVYLVVTLIWPERF